MGGRGGGRGSSVLSVSVFPRNRRVFKSCHRLYHGFFQGRSQRTNLEFSRKLGTSCLISWRRIEQMTRFSKNRGSDYKWKRELTIHEGTSVSFEASSSLGSPSSKSTLHFLFRKSTCVTSPPTASRVFTRAPVTRNHSGGAISTRDTGRRQKFGRGEISEK